MAAAGAERAISRSCSAGVKRPGWIVGIGDGDQPGAIGDAIAEGVEGKVEILIGGNADYLGSGGAHVDAVHRIGGNDDEGFVAGSEIGLAEEMNGLIDAVGEQKLRLGDGEKASHGCFDRLALGITGEIFGRQGAKTIEDSGRTADGVFVEVEAQSLASGQRRMIRGDAAYGVAWFKHERTLR